MMAPAEWWTKPSNFQSGSIHIGKAALRCAPRSRRQPRLPRRGVRSIRTDFRRSSSTSPTARRRMEISLPRRVNWRRSAAKTVRCCSSTSIFRRRPDHRSNYRATATNCRINMPNSSLKPHRRSHRSWLHARQSWVCRPRKTRTPVGILVAVAAGATESSFAKLWAVLLAESYVRSDLAGAEFFARLKPARRLWRRRLAGRPLPWFATEKAEQGAFAAFLGVGLVAHKKRWTALAVGDCCLMQVDDVGKGMRAVETFPLQRSSQFTMSPYLIGSRSDDESLKDRIQVSKGSLRDGDMLLLATDAMAAWLLKRHEEGRPLWKWLYRKLATPESFAAMVAYGRKNGLRNDDFTLVRIIHHDSRVEAKER